MEFVRVLSRFGSGPKPAGHPRSWWRWLASFFLLAAAIVRVRDMVRGKVGFVTRRGTARPSLLDDLRFGGRQHFGVFDPPPRAEQRVSQHRAEDDRYAGVELRR